VKCKSYWYGIIIVLTIFFFFIPSVVAYIPRSPFDHPVFIIVNLICTFILNIIVKFCFAYCVLRSRDLVKIDLFFSVVLVNLVIFPLYQTALSFIFTFSWVDFFFILLSLFPMTISEWLLYRLEFQKLL
jgi:hypothetical protein